MSQDGQCPSTQCAMNKQSIVVFLSYLFSTSLSAGGSHQTVDLIHVAVLDDTKFVLTVTPRPDIDGYEEYHFKGCETLIVIGEYRPLGILEAGHMPELERHKEALKFLKSKPKRFNLGYMGGGFFVPDKENKCVVQSRALDLLDENSVYSWYSGT